MSCPGDQGVALDVQVSPSAVTHALTIAEAVVSPLGCHVAALCEKAIPARMTDSFATHTL